MNPYPTLLIGLGPSGHTLLREFKRLLAGESEEKAGSVRLLWIGPTSDDEDALPELDADERIELDANLEFPGLDLRDPQMAAHYPWFVKMHIPGQCIRVDGRMAYIWEEQLNANSSHSEPWTKKLERYMAQFPSSSLGVQIWLVAALHEIEAATIFDLVFDLRRTNIRERISDISLFALLTSLQVDKQSFYNVHETTTSNQRYAALRELIRLQSRSQVYDRGGTDHLVTDTITFNRIFLYDQPTCKTALPDQWLVLLDRNVRESLASKNQLPPSLLYNTLACHTYILPIDEIRRYCAARLTFDALFGPPGKPTPATGIFPLDSETRRPTFVQPNDLFDNAAHRLLTESGSAYPGAAYAISAFSLAARGSWMPRRNTELTPNLEIAFQDRLETFLTREMNARTLQAGENEPVNAILWAQELLTALIRTLRAGEYCLIQNAARDAMAAQLASALPKLIEITRICLEELTNWEDALLKRFLPAALDSKRKAENYLQEITSEDPTRTIIMGNRDGMIPGEEIYLSQLGLPDGQKALSALRKLPIWQWQRDTARRSRLLLSVAEENRQAHFMDSSIDPHAFLDIWQATAYQWCAKFVSGLSVSKQLLLSGHRIGEKPIAPLLNQRPVPGAKRSTSDVIIGQRNADLDTWLKSGLTQNVVNQFIDIDDPGRVTLLHIESNLVVENSATLFQDQITYRSNPRWHIFVQEQHAAQVEHEIDLIQRRTLKGWRDWNPLFNRNYRFSADFTRFLFNPSAFNVFMRLIFFNRLSNDNGWKIVEGPLGLGDIDLKTSPDGSIAQVLEHVFFAIYRDMLNSQHPLFNSNFDYTLKQLDNEMNKQWEQVDSRDQLYQKLAENVPIWETIDIFHRDLAVYQKYLAYKLMA